MPKVHCKILEVGQSPTEQELRNNFIRLVRKYHPDSRSGKENSEKFSEVRNSYKLLRENCIGLTDDSSEILEKDFKICHTVPQHRRYLSYEGIGYGTPTQRQKQYQQYKIRQGHEKVHEYRIGKLTSQTEFSLAMKDATLARQYKTSHAIERLVEDMIQESILKGEFDNLPGTGKPLKRSTENPYVDSMTHKVNEILINNGFVPEWILLGKEITKESDNLRRHIKEDKKGFGPYPLSQKEKLRWEEKIRKYASIAKDINLKIDKFNIYAPQTVKQKIHFMLENEAMKILKTEIPEICNNMSDRMNIEKEQTFFGALWDIVIKK